MAIAAIVAISSSNAPLFAFGNRLFGNEHLWFDFSRLLACIPKAAFYLEISASWPIDCTYVSKP
jgi:hypothetical protein